MKYEKLLFISRLTAPLSLFLISFSLPLQFCQVLEPWATAGSFYRFRQPILHFKRNHNQNAHGFKHQIRRLGFRHFKNHPVHWFKIATDLRYSFHCSVIQMIQFHYFQTIWYVQGVHLICFWLYNVIGISKTLVDKKSNSLILR